MGLLSWIIIGLLVGVFIRRYFPGRPGGRAATLVLATTGALTGGYISSYFGVGTLALMDPRSGLFALAGALVMGVVIKILRI
ncbi:GlsB/YeaQ/YmgE family stress response membrane protein [Erwiniaceae bacterium CAU 1747]